ncbi:MAG TPA: DUF5655 domain-containing protein [Candidatus Saccharimonadales bacterium]|jgi:hypothetical protein|nr:DUF5655 domain-containing protein [Candidatus Saccharimonadales bacterium]
MSGKPSYDVHPGVAMVEKWIAELKLKTGHSLAEWLALVKRDGPQESTARREWLKRKHQLGSNSARWIVDQAEGRGGDDTSPAAYLKAATKYVETQYAGPKRKLRPIYDALLALGRSQGSDVRVCPCQTMVPLYRNHVFAQIKPTTNSRVDLGLAFAKYRGKFPSRLVDTGGLAKKDRITHRIELTASADIDADLKKWLKAAYDLDQ